MAGGEGRAEKLNGDFIRVICEGLHDVGAAVCHLQLLGHHGDQASLEQNGKENDEEDDVIQVQTNLCRVCDDQNGEDDGGSASHPGPGDQKDLAQRAAKGSHQQEDHHRTGDKGEKQGHGQSRRGDGRQLRREREQTQQEEKNHLHQPRDPVKKAHQTLLVSQRAVAQKNAGEVDTQVPVAPQQSGEDIGQQSHGNQKNRVKAIRGEAEAL